MPHLGLNTSRSPRMRRFGRFIGMVVLLAAGLEIMYLIVGNLLLPHRLSALAKQHGMELRLHGFYSFVPGVLRARQVELTSAGLFKVTSGNVRGTMNLTALFEDAASFTFFQALDVKVHVPNPAARMKAAWARMDVAHGKATVALGANLLVLKPPRSTLIERGSVQLVSLELGSMKLLGRVDIRLYDASWGSTLQGRVHVHASELRTVRQGSSEPRMQ